MQQLLQAFWQIMLLRESPSILPESKFLLGITVVAYLVVNLVALMYIETVRGGIVLIVTDFALLVLWAVFVLMFFGVVARLVQTLTALFGAASLLNLILIPIAAGYAPEQEGQGLSALRELGILFLLLWAIVVYGQIIAQAIGRSRGFGVLLAVVYFLLSYQLSAALLTGV